MTHIFLFFLTSIFVFALADRWCGGGLGWERLAHDHGGPLRGRPGYYITLPLLGGAWYVDQLITSGFALPLAVAWLLYRGAFPFPAGTLNGRRVFLTFSRHAIMPGLAAIALLIQHSYNPAALFAPTAFSIPIVHILFPLFLYAVAATMLATENGREAIAGRDINASVELARGGVFGAASVVTLFIEKVL